MVTFLPLADLRASFECLDRERLGKQRLEALWMVKRLLDNKVHTVSLMWKGHTDALCHYGMMNCIVWRERGYTDNLWPDFYCLLKEPSKPFVPPPWWGSFRLHSSHRARLLCKDAKHYRALGWTELPSESYFWPHGPNYDWRRTLGDAADASYNAYNSG